MDVDKEEDEMTMRKSLRSKRKMKSMNSMQVRKMLKKRKFPRATESASNSDDEWDALLDAHGLAPSAAAVAQPADAAGASRRARDKRRRRQRKAAKRSMWRDI